MLKDKQIFITRLHKLSDILILIASFLLAYYLKKNLLPELFRGLYDLPNYYLIFLMIIIIWYAVFNYFDIYTPNKNRTYGQIFWNLFKANVTGMLFLTLFMYVLKVTDISRIMIGIFLFLNFGFIGLSRILANVFLKYFRSKEFNLRNILIVGCGQTSEDIIKAIGSKSNSGLNILGRIKIHPDEINTIPKGPYKILGTIDELDKLLLVKTIDELIFTTPLNQIEYADKLIALAEEIGIAIRIIPDWHIHNIINRPAISKISFDVFLNTPTIYLSTSHSKHGDLFIKSIFDYIFAMLTILVTLPLLFIIPFFIKLSSKGPILFTQARCGLNGRRFHLFKFRTMVKDAEKIKQVLEGKNESKGPVFKIKKDPRIIPVIGTFLRKTGLDELPQLFNIIKGEMSFVGPRPPIPSEVEKYETWQRRRLSMKPGLTCLWQVTPNRNEINFDDWMKLDLYYIDNWSLTLDFKILLKSLLTIVTGSGR